MSSKTFEDNSINQDKLSYDTNVDLYAIGVLIYELLLGHPPFGYLQATATKEQRLEFFEKTKKGIDPNELNELIEAKLGEGIADLQENLINLMKKLLDSDEDVRPKMSKTNPK